jgi:hypothetical protein
VGTFLAEGYLSSATADGLARDGARAAAATSELAWDSGRVCYLGGVFLPADQTCLLIFEAAAAEHVGRACQRAGLPCERVTAAMIARRAPSCDPSGASSCC